MRHLVLLSVICAVLLLGCQATLPSVSRTEAPAYPDIEAPTAPANPYPEAQVLPPADGNGAIDDPTILLMPTDVPQAAVPLTQPLSDGADISQAGSYVVQISPLDTPYMVRAQTATNQVDVALAGLLVKDLGNPTCNAIVRDRLILLTSNPAATYTMDVLGPDPAHEGAVIAKITRHDNIDIALDLLASGYASLTTDPPAGFDQYMAVRDAARADLMGMWNQGECTFTEMFLQGQDA